MKELFLYVLWGEPNNPDTFPSCVIAENDEELKTASENWKHKRLITDTKEYFRLYDARKDFDYYGVVLKIPLSELPNYRGKCVIGEAMASLPEYRYH